MSLPSSTGVASSVRCRKQQQTPRVKPFGTWRGGTPRRREAVLSRTVPLRNRMTPLGEPIAVQARGLVYANRGNMHDAHRRIRRPYGVKRWIACQLVFRGWHRGRLMQPGRFTELFFLDEATAFAAGHRPCRLCRYADYET